MDLLADSNITKRALAAAFKELLETQPFAKISVGDICEKCEMNRKSFYYHFKDKYDLVNWIYYTEFVSVVRKKEYAAGWDLLEDLCVYFYDHRQFYRKIFNIDGQNSFSEYFRDMVAAILKSDMENRLVEDRRGEFFVNFFSDAFVCAIKRWMADRNCLPAEEFAGLLRRCLPSLPGEGEKALSPERERSGG